MIQNRAGDLNAKYTHAHTITHTYTHTLFLFSHTHTLTRAYTHIALSQRCSPFFRPFWPFLEKPVSFALYCVFGENPPFWAFWAEKVLKSVCLCMRSQFPSARCASARRFLGQQDGEACTRCTQCQKIGFWTLVLFCLSWTHKEKRAYSFLSSGSNLNMYMYMYHGYASLKKEHLLPVFTEKRALFQHILSNAKSTKCELKEHLWERPTRIHTHTPLDHWTPIAGGDESDATAEAIAACAGIAPFNSLQGWRIDRHYSAWSTPHSYEVAFSSQWIPTFWSFLFYFLPPTHHTTYSGMHWLLVTTQENERKVRKSLRKRRKTCVTIIVGNRTRNLSIGNRCTYHCTIWDTPTHTPTHTQNSLHQRSNSVLVPTWNTRYVQL